MSYTITFPSNRRVPHFIAFFTNGTAAVCDQWGDQLPKYQCGWHQMTIQALALHGYDYKELPEVLGTPLTSPPYWWDLSREVDSKLRLENLRFSCMDCDSSITKHMDFMARDHVWLSVHPSKKGALCLACFEKRLERKLTPEDFTESPVNQENVPCCRPNPTQSPHK